MRLILASKSPARRLVLRAAGLSPEVLVSGFDEHQVRDAVPSRLACRLAEAKAAVVVPQIEGDAIVIADANFTAARLRSRPPNPPMRKYIGISMASKNT